MDQQADILDTPGAGVLAARGSAIRVTGFVFGVALSVLGTALVTRHLGTTDYGRFQTVVALVVIAASFTDLGMSALGIREVSQRRGAGRTELLRPLLGLRIAAAIAATIAATAIAPVLGLPGEAVAGAALMGFGVVLSAVGTTWTIPLAVDLRLGALTLLDVLRQVLTTCGYVALVLAGAGLLPFLALSVPVQLVVLAVTVAVVGRQAAYRPSINRAAWVSLARPTVSFGLATATGQLYVYAALILCGLVAGAHETGLFAASFRVFVIAAAVPAILVTAAFPLLARAARDDRARLEGQAATLLRATAVLGGAALIGCVIGAGAIIAVIAGDGYDGAVTVLRIQGLALALTFVISSLGFTLLALRRHRAMVVANLAALAVSGTVVVLLASAYGARGAAWGTVAGELCLCGAYAVALVTGGDRVALRLAGGVRIAAALMAALAVGFALPLSDGVAAAVGLVVYWLVLIALRALPPEFRRLIGTG